MNVGPSGDAELKVTDHASVETPVLLIGNGAEITVSDEGSIIVGQTSTISNAVHVGANGRSLRGPVRSTATW